jgi:hypothetical protein
MNQMKLRERESKESTGYLERNKKNIEKKKKKITFWG